MQKTCEIKEIRLTRQPDYHSDILFSTTDRGFFLECSSLEYLHGHQRAGKEQGCSSPSDPLEALQRCRRLTTMEGDVTTMAAVSLLGFWDQKHRPMIRVDF